MSTSRVKIDIYPDSIASESVFIKRPSIPNSVFAFIGTNMSFGPNPIGIGRLGLIATLLCIRSMQIM